MWAAQGNVGRANDGAWRGHAKPRHDPSRDGRSRVQQHITRGSLCLPLQLQMVTTPPPPPPPPFAHHWVDFGSKGRLHATALRPSAGVEPCFIDAALHTVLVITRSRPVLARQVRGLGGFFACFRVFFQALKCGDGRILTMDSGENRKMRINTLK